RCITTSGIYQRYYEVEGVTYHHIINKNSLMPDHNYISVTLITDDCAYGDGLATAVFNMSYDEGMAFVDSHEGIYAMWVDLNQIKTYSEGFEEFIKK
ncbi:MAG: FAD:protein FMN transferase, partial [Firmicutes bacterium]|nr:FAD:protein FMN transferase [Bacillota bacterium]